MISPQKCDFSHFYVRKNVILHTFSNIPPMKRIHRFLTWLENYRLELMERASRPW